MLDQVIAVIMAGGQGRRLWPLTAKRAKPAVPIAGKFRLIDIAISNCLHSDISRIFVLTQFASQSLHRHILQTYFFPPFSKGMVQILAAQQTLENIDWYQGTADAVRQNLSHLDQRGVEYYLVLSGDHLYQMDYRTMLRTHIDAKADATLSVISVPWARASQFGIVKTDTGGRISDFYEKPEDEAIFDAYAPNPHWLSNQEGVTLPEGQGSVLASMGVYLFSRPVLFDILHQSKASDFGKGIIPEAIQHYKVVAHFFNDYWEDIGTIKTFYEVMLALTDPHPRFDFYDEKYPVYTHPGYLPGSRIDRCEVRESIICDGATLEQATIHKSIIGIRSQICTGARLDHVVLMGADYLEDQADRQRNRSTGIPDVGIGPGSVIERALIDKNARIGHDVRALTKGRRDQASVTQYVIRDGILIIPKDAVIPDGMEVG